jgi:hypothetical protein
MDKSNRHLEEVPNLTTSDKGKQSSLSEELTENKRVNLPLTTMTTIFLLFQRSGKIGKSLLKNREFPTKK